jgi:DNA topoisomerase VI subunit B
MSRSKRVQPAIGGKAMPSVNIFHASKASKFSAPALSHGPRGLGVSGCFVYSFMFYA